MAADRPYHHGNLRRELLDAAVGAIVEKGPVAFSLRDLAARAGVSHSAPAHHFGDKAGLLTAVAAEGYALLANALEDAGRDGDFLAAGVAYVRFATGHPAHFTVMFQPHLLRGDDPDLVAARRRSDAVLYGTAATVPAAGEPSGAREPRDAATGGGATGGGATEVGSGVREVATAGWCLVHGLATLWLAGNLRHLGDDPVEVARVVAATAFAGPPGP
jgi:AcrR family transcriptional regulator